MVDRPGGGIDYVVALCYFSLLKSGNKNNTDIEINIYNLTRKSKGYLSYLTLEICPDTQVKKSVNRFKGKLELGIEII